jgi:hypothetical protein
MAVEAISAVDRTRDTFSRLQTERARVDKSRADQVEADGAKSQQVEQSKQADRERVEQAAIDKDVQRTQAKKEVERERVEEQQAQREALRSEARKQAELERRERLEANREVDRVLQNQSDRARLEGLNAYRAQTEHVQAASSTERLTLQQVQAEPGRTLRAQVTAVDATRIDKIDLSEIARARLQGAVGLTIIQSSAAAASNISATA